MSKETIAELQKTIDSDEESDDDDPMQNENDVGNAVINFKTDLEFSGDYRFYIDVSSLL